MRLLADGVHLCPWPHVPVVARHAFRPLFSKNSTTAIVENLRPMRLLRPYAVDWTTATTLWCAQEQCNESINARLSHAATFTHVYSLCVEHFVCIYSRGNFFVRDSGDFWWLSSRVGDCPTRAHALTSSYALACTHSERYGYAKRWSFVQRFNKPEVQRQKSSAHASFNHVHLQHMIHKHQVTPPPPLSAVIAREHR